MASIQNLFTVGNLGYLLLYILLKQKCEKILNNGDMFKHLFTSRCADKSSLFSKCVVLGMTWVERILVPYSNDI